MPKVVSLINLKGGTGKTLITVALSEFLAGEDKKRVLVVDVDPQTNATVCLISQEDWKERNEARQTLSQLFLDRMNGTDKFDLRKAIIKGVSNVGGGIKRLDLLPSSLELIDIQDKLPMMALDSSFHPVAVLEDALQPLLLDEGDSEYDYVLIDCPPNLGLITQNALKISDGYIIPSIPDILSTLGIPQIMQRVERFEKRWQANIESLGIVLSKVRSIALHRSITEELKNKAASGAYPDIWKTEIRESARASEAMDFEVDVGTLKQKFGYGSNYKMFRDLTNEFLERCPA